MLLARDNGPVPFVLGAVVSPLEQVETVLISYIELLNYVTVRH